MLFAFTSGEKEISDSLGNLVKNGHLDMIDYLLARLADNGIKSIITPIAWWSTGWPEPDIKTNGFSQPYRKTEMITDMNARGKECRYLRHDSSLRSFPSP